MPFPAQFRWVPFCYMGPLRFLSFFRVRDLVLVCRFGYWSFGWFLRLSGVPLTIVLLGILISCL